jgi:oligopeptide/dipeptide ABC transporter ATP-binding protein
LDKKEINARIDELLEQVELPLKFKNRYPHELSGGQKQRVIIGRALATKPDLIVADEPVTGLDVSIQASIINLLQELQKEYELGILFIAHDLSIVRHFSDRVMVLYLGHVAEIGTTEELFSQPQHPYTRALKSAIPRSHPNEEKHAEIPEGEPPSPINPPSGCPFHPRCSAYIGDVCEEEYPSARELSNGRQVACHHFEDDDELRDKNYDRITLSGGQ